jgi:hypothetical protein
VTTHNRVVIETGSKNKKVFASALDWPGWSRSGKTEADALKALAEYADRYQAVAAIAGERGVRATARDFDVVEHLKGSGATDFGVPERAASCEDESMTEAECERQIRLMRACWEYFDDVAVNVSAELRKGPRGGGRDRDRIIEHVYDAERNYARKLGVKTPPRGMYTADGLREHRGEVCDAIRAVNASGEGKGSWPLRYTIRRAAWHVLDHAWEMQDKTLS